MASSFETNSQINSQVFQPFLTVRYKNAQNAKLLPPLKQGGEDYFLQRLEEKRKRKKRTIFGVSAGILALGAGVLLFSRGVNRGALNLLEKLNNKMESYAFKLGNQSKFGNGIYSFYRKSIQAGNKVLTASINFLDNLTPLKDGLTKLVFNLPVLKPIGDFITKYFEKSSKNFLKRTANSTNRQIGRYVKKVEKILAERVKKGSDELVTIGNKSQSVSAWKEEIKVLLSEIEKNNKNFTQESVISSFDNRTRNCLTDLDKRVLHELKIAFFPKGRLNLVSGMKRLFKPIISGDLISDSRLAYQKQNNVLKRQLSNGILDKTKEANRLWSQVNRMISPNDKETRRLLLNLQEKLIKFKHLSGSEELATRAQLTSEIQAIQNDIIAKVNSKGSYSAKDKDVVKGLLDEMKQVLVSQKGAIEEINTVLKGLLDRKNYLEARRIGDNTNARTNKLLKHSLSLFDKVRDYAVGGAITDASCVLGVLPLIPLFRKAKSEEEKRSVALKYGIPVVGGIAATAITTIMSFSGISSLGFGLLAGVALNFAGSFADKQLKAYSEAKKKAAQKTEVA